MIAAMEVAKIAGLAHAMMTASKLKFFPRWEEVIKQIQFIRHKGLACSCTLMVLTSH